MRYPRTAIAFITTLFAFTVSSSSYCSSRAQTTRTSSGALTQISRREKGNCTKSYDRFRNRTTTTLAPHPIMTAGNEALRLGFSAITEDDAAPREIEWLFDSTTERLRYGNKAEVRFIVDGKRVDGGVAYKSGGYAMRLFNEQLKLKMPVPRFLEITTGRKVEMQIGETEITLRREDLQLLKNFAACVNLRAE
ncbi:MAG: hypothetical protein M3R15_33300 [Acidobacteriota bacterium]|nr:hypothetical protein [Acidobacteriota bacterium]